MNNGNSETIVIGMETFHEPQSMHQSAEASFHGLTRTMERTGKDEQHSLCLITKAWNKGKTTNEFNLRWNLMTKKNGPKEGSHRRMNTEHRVYKGNLFVFSKEGMLITMFPLPEHYYHKLQYRGKERIRHSKRFDRMNSIVS